MWNKVRGHSCYGPYLCQAVVPDPVETEVNRVTNKIYSHGADILEHRKTLNKINKMHCILYVDTCYREKIKVGKG